MPQDFSIKFKYLEHGIIVYGMMKWKQDRKYNWFTAK